MKKMLLLAAVLMAALHVTAADVDLQAAKSIAQQFLAGPSAGPSIKSPNPAVKWVYQEVNSSNAAQTAYYVVNTDGGFVIVAGDDRARQVLGYGDAPLADMKSLPENMRFWLSYYKKQMEWLQARPGMKVDNSKLRASQVGEIEALLEAEWNQGDPYYGQCPMDGDRRSQTGCAATSLAQVFYKWKYPVDPTPVVPGYTTRSRGFVLDPLPPTSFDWENMLPTYTIFSPNASKTAVAQLMRYIGQAEEMDYTNEGSEAWEEDVLRACKLFGYNDAHISYKSFLNNEYVEIVYHTDAEWEVMLQEELAAGRPVVYCAYAYNTGYERYYGHAFNVDGIDANGFYHINWGWSGTGNGHFAFNAFSNQGNTYNIGQLMVMGIEPPAPLDAPVLQPADTTQVTATSFTAQWTAVEGAATYTLDVYKAGSGEQPPTGVYEKVFSESFPYCQSNGPSPITKYDSFCQNPGWTGTNGYEAKGGIRLGSASQVGLIVTPDLDMTQSGGKMTVKATMKPYSSDTDVPVAISCGNSIVEVTVSTEATYTVVLDCEEAEGQKVTIATTTGGKRVVVTQVDIYSAVEGATGMRFTVPVEEGGDTQRLITGIETTSYTVTGLLTDEYEFRVKAVSANGTESPWSNVELVTLFDYAPAYQLGDVNHDGKLNISDVTALVNMLLTQAEAPAEANVNGDSTVNISDVTYLINMLLTSSN